MEDRSHTRVRHVPAYGRTQYASTTRRRGGVLLVVLGVLADSSAGLMILVNHDVRGLLVHVPAALGWSLGISILNGWLPWRAPVGASGLRPLAKGGDGAPDQRPNGPLAQADPAYLNRWLLTSVLLGLVLFPGLGTLGCTVGFGVSRLLYKGPYQDPGVGDHVEAPDLTVRRSPRDGVDPLRDLQIQPLVDILRQPNGELKRAAIAVLGRRGSREAMRLMQGALTDPDPDVRGDAAERYADLCYRYASSDLLDAATSRYYLVQARDALQQVTALQPERAEVWTDLARVCYDLGEEADAWQALDRAQALCPGHVATYLLGMEMAFDARDWDRLAAYAHQGRLAAGDDHEDYELLSWWAHAQPLAAHGADRSTT